MSGHSHDLPLLISGWSWSVPLLVLGASLAGSLHCVGMCSGLVLAVAKSRAQMAAYHVGRLVAYVSLGALAAAGGGRLLHQASSGAWSWLAAFFMGAMFFWMGLSVFRGKGLHLQLPTFAEKWRMSLWRGLLGSGAPRSLIAFAAGALTALLPCGWLYGFVLASAATGKAWAGAVFMAAFWLGTVPALGFGLGAIRGWLNPWLAKTPRLSGTLLMAAGLVTLAIRFQHNHGDARHAPVEPPAAAEQHSHEGHVPAPPPSHHHGH